MKQSAWIKHKSHTFFYCPFNLYSDWLPDFCVLSKYANPFFPFVLQEKYEDLKQGEVFLCVCVCELNNIQHATYLIQLI